MKRQSAAIIEHGHTIDVTIIISSYSSSECVSSELIVLNHLPPILGDGMSSRNEVDKKNNERMNKIFSVF